MDLISRGRTDLAHVFLSAWLEASGDYEGLRVLRLYAVHRALVRAKVDALQLASPALGPRRAELEARFRHRLNVSVALTRAEPPFMLLMCGLSGSGKSWLSTQLVGRLDAVRVRSDVERKRLAGGSATSGREAAVGEGIYDRATSDRTYARLLECAEAAIAGGENVIVDATFLEGAHRELFLGLAHRQTVRVVIVACEAPHDTLRERVQRRAAQRLDASEADLDVLSHQIASREGFTPHEELAVLTIDTQREDLVDHAVAAIRQRLGTRVAR